MSNKLMLLKLPFKDSDLSDDTYFCWNCLLLEGLLSQFPEALWELEVSRHDFPRPRAEVVDVVGDANQSLPTLVLGEGVLMGQETGTFNETRFVKGKDQILSALAQIYAIPVQHP